jgi:hypothetical protein
MRALYWPAPLSRGLLRDALRWNERPLRWSEPIRRLRERTCLREPLRRRRRAQSCCDWPWRRRRRDSYRRRRC